MCEKCCSYYIDPEVSYGRHYDSGYFARWVRYVLPCRSVMKKALGAYEYLVLGVVSLFLALPCKRDL